MLTNRAVDLKNVWVVFKRMKKVNWYHRGPNYSVCTTNATKAAKFGTKEEADIFCAKINTGRKSYRFKVETASKHFVNNWSINYESWRKEVVISSKPIGIDRLAKLHSHESYRPTLDNQKSKIVTLLETHINQYTNDIKETDANLTRNLERAKREYDNAIAYAHKNHTERRLQQLAEQAKFVSTKDTLLNTDLDTEYVEKLGTEMDKKASILFGSKANVNS